VISLRRLLSKPSRDDNKSSTQINWMRKTRLRRQWGGASIVGA
jgi:hypothetical protein